MEVSWHTVRNTPDGRFVVVAPDGLTWVQVYAADEMDAADTHAARLNLPAWQALRPKGLEGYEPPAPDPGDVLLELLDRTWRYEDGPPLKVVPRNKVYDYVRWEKAA